MKELEFLILEDDFLFATEIELLLSKLGYDKVTIFSNAKQAKKHFTRKKPDLILLDINLEGNQNGVDFAESIVDKNVMTIFFTAYKDEQLYEKAMKLNPHAYLIKPFSLITLKSTIELAVNQLHFQTSSQSFFIKEGRKYFKLYYENILWIQSNKNYITLQTQDRKFIEKVSLTSFTKFLPSDEYIKIHRGVVVKFSEIDQVDLEKGKAIIGNDELPIGGKYKPELIGKMKNLRTSKRLKY